MSAQETEQLRADFERHRLEQDERWDTVLEEMRKTSDAVQRLTESTEGVVRLYNDLQGAARVGIALQKFVVWCSKWGVIGTIAAWLLTYIVDNYARK